MNATELLKVIGVTITEETDKLTKQILNDNQAEITQSKTAQGIADLLNSKFNLVNFTVSSKNGNLQELVATGGVVGNQELASGDFRIKRDNEGSVAGILLAKYTDTNDGVVTNYSKNLATSNGEGKNVITLYHNIPQLFRLSDKGWTKFVNGILRYLSSVTAIEDGKKVPVIDTKTKDVGGIINPTIGDLLGIVTGRVQIDATLLSDSHAEMLQRMIDMYSDQPDNLLVIPSTIWYQYGYNKFADDSGVEYLFWKGSIEGDNMTYDGGFVMTHFDQFNALVDSSTPDFEFTAKEGSDGILYLSTMTDSRLGSISTTQLAYSATTSTKTSSSSSVILDYDELHTALDQLFNGSIDSTFISTVVKIGRQIPVKEIESVMSQYHDESEERMDALRSVISSKVSSMTASSDQIKSKLGEFSYNYVYNPYGIEDGKELSTDAKTKLSKLVEKSKSLDSSVSSILSIFNRLGISL